MTEKTGKGKANFNMKFESFHGNEVANNEKLRECGMKKKKQEFDAVTLERKVKLCNLCNSRAYPVQKPGVEDSVAKYIFGMYW